MKLAIDSTTCRCLMTGLHSWVVRLQWLLAPPVLLVLVLASIDFKHK